MICKRNNRPENNNEIVCNGMRKKQENYHSIAVGNRVYALRNLTTQYSGRAVVLSGWKHDEKHNTTACLLASFGTARICFHQSGSRTRDNCWTTVSRWRDFNAEVTTCGRPSNIAAQPARQSCTATVCVW